MLENFGSLFSNKKRVVVVGVGGLGSATALSLVSEGITDLTIIDNDIIELSNLDRQSLYSEEDLGRFKADMAKKALLHARKGVRITSVIKRLTADNLHLLSSSLVIDCTDNLETRYLINSYCKKKMMPWVFCTVAGAHGLAKFIRPNGPCLSCFYKRPGESETSSNIGIVNSAVQLASSIQSSLALSYLRGEPVEESLISFSAWHSKIKKITVKKNCGECK